MSPDLVSTFGDALAAHDVTWDRVESDDLGDALSASVRDPAVGAPLGIEGISLPDSISTHPTPGELREANTGVTPVGPAIASYGTVVVRSRPGGDEPVSLYPERHVGVLRESDLVPDVAAAIDRLGPAIVEDRESAVLTTGPSATGDMGALVQGVHGPHEVHVIVLEDL